MSLGFGWMELPWVMALGWTLVHSVWELAALALVAGGVLVGLRRGSAGVRYGVALGFLGGMALIVAGTFGHLVRNSFNSPERVETRAIAPDQVASDPAIVIRAGISEAASRSNGMSFAGEFERMLPWMSMGYLVIAALLAMRLVVGHRALRRLSYSGKVLEGPPAAMLQEIRARMGIRRFVRLVESAAVEVPTVLGAVRPLILLPVSALTGLSAEQLEGLLAHELAHVRRHDYVVNVLQSVIETVLFYHPAVWWLSRVVRQEREHCCDDVAAKLVGSRARYANALASMESLRHQSDPFPRRLAVAADSGVLLTRIQRLLGEPSRNTRLITTPVMLTCIGCITLLVFLMPARAQHKSVPDDAERILLLPTPPRGAESQPALHLPPDTMIFDVRDLMVLPSDSTPSPAVIIGPQPEAAPRQTEEAVIQQLIDTIERNVDPKSWKDHGGNAGEIMNIGNGRLYIHQTKENFARITKLLKLLKESHGRQISIESRILLVDDDFIKRLGEKYPSLVTAVVHTGALPADILSDKQLSEFLEGLQNAPTVMSIATPRVTVFDGQNAEIMLQRERGFIAKSSDAPPHPIASTVSTGIVLGLQAAIGADHQSLAVKATLETRTLLKMKDEPQYGPDGKVIPYQEPEMDIRKLPTLFSVKDGNTAVFGGVEVIPPQLPSDSKRPIADADSEKPRRVIILVRPKIIEQKQLENEDPGTP